MRRGLHPTVPGVALVVLACVGVLALLAAANPTFRTSLLSTPVTSHGEPPRRAAIDVDVVPSSPSARATGRLSPSSTPTPTPTPTSSPSSATSQAPTARPQARPPTSPAATSPTAAAARCRAGGATVTAVADAYVDQAMPTANFGAADNLVVAGRDKDRNRRALVRFALPTIPAGCTLRSATLAMTAKDATGRRLLVSRAARGWHESTVTWQNAPGPTGATSSATVTATDVRCAVTGLVAAAGTSGDVGFLVRDAAEGRSGEGTQTNLTARTGRGGPVLVLRWS